ncbi:glycerate kinase [Streptomyces wuyuanensis]|uniref:Glycerate kinase n=1 Tax=Streptomyces wuyuanensis TaxID=1196353 RepID=A0A1G9QXR6_9ACTN|nr:glycerate kinase [Streptomyces wuyuanensis]
MRPTSGCPRHRGLGRTGAELAAVGARLPPRFDVLLDHPDLDARLATADLVVTDEGDLDGQTPHGKIPAEAARRAKRAGRPVPALAGTLGHGAHEVRGAGVDAYATIVPAPRADEALGRAGEFLADAAERAMRMILLRARLAPPAAAAPNGPRTGGRRRPGPPWPPAPTEPLGPRSPPAPRPAPSARAAHTAGTQRPSSVR